MPPTLINISLSHSNSTSNSDFSILNTSTLNNDNHINRNFIISLLLHFWVIFLVFFIVATFIFTFFI